ncbi:hypothetical protein FACS189481_0100 [Clostridia bacterium]|nr:hypothetical protein FACS189481_0100 [Clostridia bacterium]
MRLFPAFSTVYIPEKTYTGHGGLLQQAAIRLLTLAATKYEDRLTKPDFLAVGADLTAAGARVEEQRGVVMAARTASPDDKKDLDLDFVVVAVHFLSSRGDLVTKFANSIREDNVKVVFAPAAAAASDSDWLCGSACASGCGAGSGAGAGEGSGLFEAEREEQERIDRARLESEKKREEGYKKVAAACAEQEKKKEEIARLRKQHDDLEREIADQQKKQYRLAEEDGQRDEQLEKIEEEIEKLEAEEQALAAKLERDEILASQSTSLQKHNEASIDTAEKMRYGGPSSSAAAAAAAHTSLDADSQGILAKLQSNYSVIDSLLEQLRGAQSAENGERTAEKARVTTQLEALRAEQKALRENYERHLQEKEKLEQEKQELQEKRARVEREIEKLEEECTVIDKTVGIGALQTLKYTE